MYRKLFYLLLAVALVLPLAACGPQDAADDGDHGPTDVLRVGLGGRPETLDPHVAASRAVVLLYNMYEPLVDLDRDTTNIVGELAEDWDVSADGLTYTFYLRRGVKFHDGTDFTGEDVKASFDRIRGLKTGAYWALNFLKDVTVKDDFTVEMTIEAGGPPFIQAVALIPIVSADAIEANKTADDEWGKTWFYDHVAGTGPYTLESWSQADRVVMTKFDDYWQGWDGKHFSKAIFFVIPEASQQVLQLEGGDLDITERFDPESLDNMRANEDITVIEEESGVRVLYIRINSDPNSGATGNVLVRKAINYAFDFEGFHQAMSDTIIPTNEPVPNQWLKDTSIPIEAEYDLDKARQYLAEAGYEPGELTLNLSYLARYPEQQLAAEMLQAGLKEIGVTLELRPSEWGPMVDHMVAWGDDRQPDTALHMFLLWTPPRIPDAYAYLWYMYHTDAQGGLGRNLMYYGDPEVDSLIDQGSLSDDPDERLDYYIEATRKVASDYPDVVLGLQRQIYVHRSDIGGFYVYPTWYPVTVVYPLYRITD